VLNWNGVLVASRGSTSTSVHEELFQWNGADWDTLATANGLVGAIQAHAGGLVVFGTFTKIGGVTANHVALFDGSTWHAMGRASHNGPTAPLGRGWCRSDPICT
jgi:hypothetical protein